MTSYKCSICGKKCQTIGSLSKHRSKDHPGAARKPRTKKLARLIPREMVNGWEDPTVPKFCPHCGQRIRE